MDDHRDSFVVAPEDPGAQATDRPRDMGLALIALLMWEGLDDVSQDVMFEYGLSFLDGRRIVRYSSRQEAEAEMQKHPHSALVCRTYTKWCMVDWADNPQGE